MHTVTDDGGQQIHVRREAVLVSPAAQGRRGVAAAAGELTQVLNLTGRLDAASTSDGNDFQYDEDSSVIATAASRARSDACMKVVDVTGSDSEGASQASQQLATAASFVAGKRGARPTNVQQVSSSTSSSGSREMPPPTSPGQGGEPPSLPEWGSIGRFPAARSFPIAAKVVLQAARCTASGEQVSIKCICAGVVGSLQYQGGYKLRLNLADPSGMLQVDVAPAVVCECIGASADALTHALGDKSAPGKARRKDAKSRVRHLASLLSRFMGFAQLRRGSAPGQPQWTAEKLTVCFDAGLNSMQEAR
jgi:hypothetical protein